MTCHNRQSICNRFGKHRNGVQRYRCSQCRKTFTEDHATPLDTMRLPMEKATAILKLMVEGMSVRSIERFTGSSPRYDLAAAPSGGRALLQANRSR